MDDTPRIAELRKKLEKDPASRLFAQLAEELRKEGRHEDAIAVARNGLEKSPNYPSARLTLARALLDAGRPGEARPELEQIVKASPDNILASRLLGEALQNLGEPAQAIQQFERTLKLSPDDKGLLERTGELKRALAPPRIPLPVPAVPATLPPLPSVLAQAPTPSVFPEVPVFPEVALPSVPEVVATEPAIAPVSGAFDRDLASGTLSPGSLGVTDLQRHFEVTATSAAPQELPSVEMPAEEPDPGGQTLPLTSMTLADLYLQQGLKAEATAVLSQVMKDEPENAQAKSKFEAVAGEPAPSHPEPPPPVPPRVEALALPVPRTRHETREQSIASLKAFLSAVEREAVQQRATERGAF